VEHLVLALTQVAGASAACAERGDAATVETLADYYAVLAGAAADAGGRVIKVIGDGALLVFPRARARDAVDALRDAQGRGTARWQALDPRCRVLVKVGAGPVVHAPMGPPGEERDDVYGDALNRLFKAAVGERAGDFVLTPEAEALLRDA
ncbi:MAG TPA: hypothetical protein VKA84_18995, partial [Gemmatimonadaceae bacterium]|nr:hypothetical protein [Gemmatimonadaceae bacterium]